MSQLFGECLAEWMRENALTPAALAERTGYRSKTTVIRFLQGSSSCESCGKYLETLKSRFGLTEEWKRRFHRALLTEKYGAERIRLYEALYGQMIENRINLQPAAPIATGLTDGCGEILILGCPWLETFQLVSEALERSPGVKIRHYIAGEELLSGPAVLRGLIAFLPDARYSAFLVGDEAKTGRMWNVICVREKDGGERILAGMDGSFASLLPGGDSGVFDRTKEQLSGLPGKALYRFDHLESGADYVRFLKECCRCERNRRTLIVKPTPGIQMIPVGITAEGLGHYLGEKDLFNVRELDEAMTALCRRVDNFYGREEKTYLVFSPEGIHSFAENGLLADQPYMMKPYSAGERKEILAELLRFSGRENAALYLLRDRSALPFSFEIYKGSGTLIYPSNASYNTESAPYRELFLPDRGVEELFVVFTMNALIAGRCLSREESRAKLEDLVRRMPGD